jgi:chromate transporter
MMDGLALGETTPGPLIIVVAYVGFIGGWSKQALGPDTLFLGAALAATVVTWFTFLPSFVFILAGGPLVESTHGKLQFTAPLTAITAAVVGVIASLALFFIMHIAYRSGVGGGIISEIDFASVALIVLAVLALLRYKRGVICLRFGWFGPAVDRAELRPGQARAVCCKAVRHFTFVLTITANSCLASPPICPCSTRSCLF